jgi:ABC-2 type transport system permease protein
MIERFKKYSFLFQVLVKRDFVKKYNRTVLGALWSLLSPLLTVTAQAVIFTHFFGRTQAHFVVYMFIGNVIFGFFRDATVNGMMTIEGNAGIITKIRVPMYLFIFSRNITALINMLLTLLVLVAFCVGDSVPFTWRWLLVPYPIACLTAFNIGAGMLLSGVYVFFRDTRYLYDVFCTILMYFSAIFYTTSSFPAHVAWLFNANPVFCYISYARKLVLDARIPSLQHTFLCLGYAAAALGAGSLMYCKKSRSYVYNL